jgi:FixJ family two-component response regulator
MNARLSPLESSPCAKFDATPVVFVVDDDVAVRESLEVLIRSAGWQVESCASANDFLARAHGSVPSCVVLDVSLPDIDGLELQRRIAGERNGTPVVFITGYADVPTTVRAMKAGAVDFLTKPLHDGALLAAVANAIEQSCAGRQAQTEMDLLQERHASLTRREREVMALVTAGKLNKQVAADLGISEITVKAHRGKMMQKMRARSFAALVNMAARLGGSPARSLAHGVGS